MTTSLTTRRATATITLTDAQARARAVRYHDRYRAVRDAVTSVQRVIDRAHTDRLSESDTCTAVREHTATLVDRLDTGRRHPDYSPAALRVFVAGRVTYAARTLHDADLYGTRHPGTDPAPALRVLDDLAAKHVAWAAHLLSGCHGVCCGHSVAAGTDVCMVPAIVKAGR